MNKNYSVGQKTLITLAVSGLFSATAVAKTVSDSVVADQRAALQENTAGKGYGPQSPRDIDQAYGTNLRKFGFAPNRGEMNLCNIHFHKNAEHKGGDYTTHAGNGDGKGKGTGYVYDGKLSRSQLKSVKQEICGATGNPLKVGDTIEVHWVHTSCDVAPGPGLGSCLSDACANPDLRVETQVFTLVNDSSALNFNDLSYSGNQSNGFHQAKSIPSITGVPVEFMGSTTGPKYTEQACSALQVTWSVRPECAKLDINTIGKWCESNVFEEDHAHGVRKLVTDPRLLAPIQ